MCAYVLSPTLCDPMDCSLPVSSLHGVPQARILEWLAVSYSGGLPDPGIETMSLASPSLAGRFFTTATPGKLHVVYILPQFLKYIKIFSSILLGGEEKTKIP